jgi:hypothetical protein
MTSLAAPTIAKGALIQLSMSPFLAFLPLLPSFTPLPLYHFPTAQTPSVHHGHRQSPGHDHRREQRDGRCRRKPGSSPLPAVLAYGARSPFFTRAVLVRPLPPERSVLSAHLTHPHFGSPRFGSTARPTRSRRSTSSQRRAACRLTALGR